MPPLEPQDQLGSPSRRTASRALSHRWQLAAIEWKETESAFWRAGLCALLAGAFAAAVLIAGLVIVVTATWDTSWRITAPVLTSLVYAIGAGVAAWKSHSIMTTWQPFEETRRQVAADIDVLREELSGKTRSTPPPSSSTQTPSDHGES